MMRIAFIAITTLLLSESALGEDFDGDGVEDPLDNCLRTANPQQCDTDGDFCGNRCDADYNNDGIVDWDDWGGFARAFGRSDDLEKDHTEPCTGPISFADFGFFGGSFGKRPGPSGTTPGIVACPIW